MVWRTPAALRAGATSAARRGILVRDGVALEKAGKITAVIFDKTGTLTMGKPEVAAIAVTDPLAKGEGTATATARKSNTSNSNPALDKLLPLPAGEGRGEGKEIKQLAATVARHSTHTISQAIAKISDEKVQATDWQEIRGY